jgi:lauroyl/myristoyl acyltransferase
MSIFRSIRRRWRNKPGILPWLTSWPARATALGLSGLPATWASRLGAWIGAIIWWIPRRRKLGIENYSQANPQATEAEVTAVVQESCKSMGRMGVEMMVVLEKYRGKLLSRIEFEPGAQELLESLRGQGALFLQAH